MPIEDIGPKPQAFDIESETKANTNYRTVVWTGQYLQVTLMSIPPGGDVGLEVHPETDQFLRLDAGKGRVQLGSSKDTFEIERDVEDGWSIQVPAGTWHNVTNIGDEPMQLYAVYAPVHHSPGKVHVTKEDGDTDENDDPPAWAKNTQSADDQQA